MDPTEANFVVLERKFSTEIAELRAELRLEQAAAIERNDNSLAEELAEALRQSEQLLAQLRHLRRVSQVVANTPGRVFSAEEVDALRYFGFNPSHAVIQQKAADDAWAAKMDREPTRPERILHQSLSPPRGERNYYHHHQGEANNNRSQQQQQQQRRQQPGNSSPSPSPTRFGSSLANSRLHRSSSPTGRHQEQQQQQAQQRSGSRNNFQSLGSSMSEIQPPRIGIVRQTQAQPIRITPSVSPTKNNNYSNARTNSDIINNRSPSRRSALQRNNQGFVPLVSPQRDRDDGSHVALNNSNNNSYHYDERETETDIEDAVSKARRQRQQLMREKTAELAYSSRSPIPLPMTDFDQPLNRPAFGTTSPTRRQVSGSPDRRTRNEYNQRSSPSRLSSRPVSPNNGRNYNSSSSRQQNPVKSMIDFDEPLKRPGFGTTSPTKRQSTGSPDRRRKEQQQGGSSSSSPSKSASFIQQQQRNLSPPSSRPVSPNNNTNSDSTTTGSSRQNPVKLTGALREENLTQHRKVAMMQKREQEKYDQSGVHVGAVARPAVSPPMMNKNDNSSSSLVSRPLTPPRSTITSELREQRSSNIHNNRSANRMMNTTSTIISSPTNSPSQRRRPLSPQPKSTITSELREERHSMATLQTRVDHLEAVNARLRAKIRVASEAVGHLAGGNNNSHHRNSNNDADDDFSNRSEDQQQYFSPASHLTRAVSSLEKVLEQGHSALSAAKFLRAPKPIYEPHHQHQGNNNNNTSDRQTQDCFHSFSDKIDTCKNVPEWVGVVPFIIDPKRGYAHSITGLSVNLDKRNAVSDQEKEVNKNLFEVLLTSPLTLSSSSSNGMNEQSSSHRIYSSQYNNNNSSRRQQSSSPHNNNTSRSGSLKGLKNSAHDHPQHDDENDEDPLLSAVTNAAHRSASRNRQQQSASRQQQQGRMMMNDSGRISPQTQSPVMVSSSTSKLLKPSPPQDESASELQQEQQQQQQYMHSNGNYSSASQQHRHQDPSSLLASQYLSSSTLLSEQRRREMNDNNQQQQQYVDQQSVSALSRILSPTPRPVSNNDFEDDLPEIGDASPSLELATLKRLQEERDALKNELKGKQQQHHLPKQRRSDEDLLASTMTPSAHRVSQQQQMMQKQKNQYYQSGASSLQTRNLQQKSNNNNSSSLNRPLSARNTSTTAYRNNNKPSTGINNVSRSSMMNNSSTSSAAQNTTTTTSHQPDILSRIGPDVLKTMTPAEIEVLKRVALTQQLREDQKKKKKDMVMRRL